MTDVPPDQRLVQWRNLHDEKRDGSRTIAPGPRMGPPMEPA